MSRNGLVALITAAIAFVIVNIVFWSIVLSPRSAVNTGASSRANQTISALPSPRPTVTLPSQTTTPTPLPPVPSPASASAPPLPTAPDVILTSVDQIIEAARAGQHGTPFRLVFSEQQIRNEVVAYLAANPDLAFNDVDVSLQQGQAIITGRARILAFSVDFRAATTIIVINGRPRLKVLSLDVLGGLVPGFVKEQLIQMIEQSADLPLLADQPVTISDVKIEPGQAVVVGNLI